jgi:mono/diheme cytochrome c family protein
VIRHIALALALLGGACQRKVPPPAPAPAPAAPAALTVEQRTAAEHALAQDCAICHSLDLVHSQRLSRAQWEKELKKMTGWGAPVQGGEGELLVSWLSERNGTDAPEPEVVEVTASQAAGEVAPDFAPVGGDPARGATLYHQDCASCHGPDGAGASGPCLVDRPVAFRPRDFTDAVRVGRGRMPSFPNLDGRSTRDMLAFLRLEPSKGSKPPATPSARP